MVRLTFIIAYFLFFLGSTVPANAQDIVWEDPYQLTEDDSVVQFSAIAADSQGLVHAFWAYHPESVEPDNAIYYRYRDEFGWSGPNDILIGRADDTLSLPFVFVDQTDQLHLLWSGSQGLYYSAAPAATAHNANSWTTPSTVVRGTAIGRSSLVIDQNGILHVVYSRRAPGTNVMYVRSEDSGLTWSHPLPLSTIFSMDEHAPDYATIAIDGQGILHVVWSENYPPEFIGREVYYVQSLNGGLNWSSPTSLSGLRMKEWTGNPNIIVDSADKLHVMWAGCASGAVARCYNTSTDHGESWVNFKRPFGDLVGSSGVDAIAADPHGNLFWAGALRSPQAVYASSLTGDFWENPPQTLLTEEGDGPLGLAHFPEMAVGQGNQLNLLLVEMDGGPLWYMHGQTPFPQVVVEVPEIPTVEATLAVEEVSLAQEINLTPTPHIEIYTRQEQSSEFNSLLWPVLAVSGLLLLIVIISRRWKR